MEDSGQIPFHHVGLSFCGISHTGGWNYGPEALWRQGVERQVRESLSGSGR